MKPITITFHVDSDDGYGDSSEIMFDAEDENDIIYHPPLLQDGASTSTQHSDQGASNPEEFGLSARTRLPQPLTTDLKSEANATMTPFSSISSAKLKFSVKPVLKEQPHTDSIEEEVLEELIEEVCVEEPVGKSLSIGSDAGEGSQGSEEGLEDLRQGHNYEEDDDVFEDESEQEIEEELSKDDSSTLTEQISNDSATPKDASADTQESARIGSKVRHKNEVSESSSETHSERTSDLPAKGVRQEETGSPNPPDLTDSNLEAPTKEANLESLNLETKPTPKETSTPKPSKLKPNKGANPTPQTIPSIKQSLSPYEISPSKMREPRGRKPLSKSLVAGEHRPNRARLNASNLSPTKSPLEAPVRTSRDVRARKGSPDPRRSSRFYDKKPVKAIHNQATTALSKAESKPPKPVSGNVGGVRKAASTSDLCR